MYSKTAQRLNVGVRLIIPVIPRLLHFIIFSFISKQSFIKSAIIHVITWHISLKERQLHFVLPTATKLL